MQKIGLLRLAQRREIARESDRLYRKAESMGRDLSAAKLNPTQIHHLETIACTTDKVSDIWDFIKKQVGKHKEWQQGSVGSRLLNELCSLDAGAAKIMKILKEQNHETGPDTAREIHLELCREYIEHLVAQFEYDQA